MDNLINASNVIKIFQAQYLNIKVAELEETQGLKVKSTDHQTKYIISHIVIIDLIHYLHFRNT